MATGSDQLLGRQTPTLPIAVVFENAIGAHHRPPIDFHARPPAQKIDASTEHPPELAAEIEKNAVVLADRLVKAGKAVDALASLESACKTLPSPHLIAYRDRLRRCMSWLERAAGERIASGESTAVVALGRILQIVAAGRSKPKPARSIGSIALITGHLGAGGAELQLSRTAEMLASAARSGRMINGVAIRGPVSVAVKTLRPEGNRPLDFFLPRLIGADVPVSSLDSLPSLSIEEMAVGCQEIEDLLHIVPPGIRRGLRMRAWFKANKVETAYIWQDGSILDCALAALLADVPRLVVNFRGMPPLLRWKESLDEYKELYCALADMPGVSFVSNSAAAADAYATWLGCPRKNFHIVRNGVATHAPHPSRREIDIWAKFAASTEDASVTIGGIFRMHPNKRPLEWIRFARHYLDANPRARFVLIGSGILQDQVRELVRRLGLSRRILLLPQTSAGAYWLKKMDAFVLLSRFEGTPNVLIEAQLAGIPVVSTPIADSRDTFIEGITGLSTASGKFLDVNDVLDKVDRVIAFSKAGSVVREHARRHIASRFSPEAMIQHTVKVLVGCG